MQKLLTSAQAADLDCRAIDVRGMPGVVLMEHAGKAVAEAARDLLGPPPAHLTVICGKGNNGGDGFVAARWLRRWGYIPEVFLLGEPGQVGGDAKVNLDLWLGAGHAVESITPEDDLVLLAGSLRRAGLVIDAMLGTGVTGSPRPPFDRVIDRVNQSGRPVLAVDLPTGVNADTGHAYRPAVRATRTLTFAAWKRGLALHPGANLAGTVVLVDIGLPTDLLEAVEPAPVLLEAGDIAALLPPRPADAHKGDAGRVLLVGGSPGMAGAPLLAARAALRAGAGLVTVGLPASLADLAVTASLEVMTRALPETDTGAVATNCFAALEPLLPRVDAVGIGPGLGTTTAAAELIADLAEALAVPLVLDADALNLLARHDDLLAGHTGTRVITPHPGEAGRLLAMSAASVQADRLGTASRLARQFDAVCVLKGAHTVIATPAGQLAVCPVGNPAMATAGMGDTLTGVVTALLAAGLEPFAAASAAVWLHGSAGDLAAGGGDAGLLAGDVVELLPEARRRLREPESIG